MTDSPLVSVIVPFYNVAPYAEECVKALCRQSLRNIEIICIDDGSSDDTPRVLEKMAARDSRIQLICKENEGAGATRNLGLDLARGKYVSILDSDDKYNLRMLEIAVVKAEITDADVVLYRSSQYIQRDDCYLETPWVVKLPQIPSTETFAMGDIASNRFFAFQGWAWDKLFRRDFIESHNLRFQNTRIYNDMYFVFAACLLARRMTYVDSVLIHQRKRGGGSLSDAPSAHWESIFEALSGVRGVVGGHDVSAGLKEDFEAYVLHMVKRQLDLCGPSDKEAMEASIRQTWAKSFPVLQELNGQTD